MRVPIQCLKHKISGNHESVFLDSSLDRSGWTPASLDFLGELVTQLPAETASDLAQKAGMSVSRAELDRLGRALGQACSEEHRSVLVKLAHAPLEPAQPEGGGRAMVVQMDGCFVLGQARDGKCPGVVLDKSALSWIERHLSGLSALEAQRQLMRDLMQSVVDDHAPPPPQDLENPMEVSGTAVSAGPSPMGEGTRTGAVPQASRKRKS